MGFISWERKETEPLSTSIYMILKWYYIVKQAPARRDGVILVVAHVQAYLSMHMFQHFPYPKHLKPSLQMMAPAKAALEAASAPVSAKYSPLHPGTSQEFVPKHLSNAASSNPNILLTLNIWRFRKVHLWSMKLKPFRMQHLQLSDLQQGSVPNYKPKGSQSQQHTRVCIFGRDVLSPGFFWRLKAFMAYNEYVYEIMLLPKTFVKNLSRPSLQLS